MLNRLAAAALVGLCMGAWGLPAVQTNLQQRDLNPNLPGFEGVYDQAQNITWLADPQASGARSFNSAAQWADGLAVGAFVDWRIATGLEMARLWDDWQSASIGEFGGTFFSDPSTSADAGMGSHLFTRDPFIPLWDRNAEIDFANLWAFERHSSDQGPAAKDGPVAGFAWAVLAGDVVAPGVPEPATSAAVLTGLAALLGRAYRWRRG